MISPVRKLFSMLQPRAIIGSFNNMLLDCSTDSAEINLINPLLVNNLHTFILLMSELRWEYPESEVIQRQTCPRFYLLARVYLPTFHTYAGTGLGQY